MVVVVNNVTKLYPGNVVALDNISFSVNEGEVVGLVGPNGAGKSTLMHLLAGILTPDKGNIEILGRKPTSDIKGLVNLCAGSWRLFRKLSIGENLKVFAKIYNVKNEKETINNLLKEWNIEDIKNREIQKLSAGQRTRALLCKALINSPKLLLLDEPTTGLDGAASEDIRNLVKKTCRNNKTTIVLASHNMDELKDLTDRILFISKGKITEIKETKGITLKALQEKFVKLCRGKL